MQAGNGQACSPLSEIAKEDARECTSVSERYRRRCSTVNIRVRTWSELLDNVQPSASMVKAALRCTAVYEHGQSCSAVFSSDVLGDDGVPFNGVASPRS